MLPAEWPYPGTGRGGLLWRLSLVYDPTQELGERNGRGVRAGSSTGKGVSGLVGPVSPRRARARLAAERRRAVRGDRVRDARRAGAGRDRGARAGDPPDRDGVRRELSR